MLELPDFPSRRRHRPIAGAEIRRARETHRMTQEELAEVLGVSARTVGNWERGTTVPRNRVGALADVLGILPDGTGHQPRLCEASSAELVAEIARRLGENTRERQLFSRPGIAGRPTSVGIPFPRGGNSRHLPG